MKRVTYFANHEDLVRLSKLGKLLERRHKSLVIVPSTSCVDEDNVITFLRSMAHSILGDCGSILAVTLLIKLNATTLTGRQLLEVTDVNSELLDGAGTESVTGGDENLVFVLKKEEANL